VIVLFVAAQGYLAYTSLEAQEDDLVDDIVMSETRRLVERIGTGESPIRQDGPPISLGRNQTAWLRPVDAAGAGAAGTDAAPPLPEHLMLLSDGTHMMHRSDHVYHAIVQTIPSGRLYVEYDATANEEFVYRFGRYLVATGLLCIALGWVIASLVARVVVAPLRRRSERLSNWSPGSGARPPTARSDEETMLLDAFDRSQRRLEEALMREREFVSNVRHEVRTPLAALRTDAEMLLLTGAVSAAGEGRLRRMIAAVDSVVSGLDAVHALSSATPGKQESVPLAQCIDDVWQSLAHVAGERGATLLNEVPRGDTVQVDRLALMTILRNLLRNAIEHASPGRCRVTRTAHGITVSDDGPGIDVEDRPFVFDRYFQGRLLDSPGTESGERGLGLAIARQTADLQGWRLELGELASVGAAFRLDFQQLEA
jgi:signal transduction histidine kinase